jgi:hypothetical protein
MLVLPYQVVFALCFVFYLFHSRKNQLQHHPLFNFEFSVLMFVLWLLPITVPTILAWFHEMEHEFYAHVLPLHINSYQSVISMVSVMMLVQAKASAQPTQFLIIQPFMPA